MSSIRTAMHLLKTDKRAFNVSLMQRFAKSKLSCIVPDKLYLSMQYRAVFGKKLDLKDPKTFNEKLQWIKIFDRNSDYNIMVDKYGVRDYIEDKIGPEYLFPCLGVWNSVEEINFDTLPQKFVLKCTHDSGSVIICDKENLDIECVRRNLRKKLNHNMFWWGREWPYRDVKPRIIAEKYMTDDSGELRDYKFMCFNGKVKCTFVCTDRFSEKGLHVTFFDRDWHVMPFERSFPSVKEGLEKPINYEKMIELAERLSSDIPFVRVDFYEVNGRIYFGELTFFPGNGMEAFQPEEWDYHLGEWLELPNVH